VVFLLTLKLTCLCVCVHEIVFRAFWFAGKLHRNMRKMASLRDTRSNTDRGVKKLLIQLQLMEVDGFMKLQVYTGGVLCMILCVCEC
jgi:hypothetical protein